MYFMVGRVETVLSLDWPQVLSNHEHIVCSGPSESEQADLAYLLRVINPFPFWWWL